MVHFVVEFDTNKGANEMMALLFAQLGPLHLEHLEVSVVDKDKHEYLSA